MEVYTRDGKLCNRRRIIARRPKESETTFQARVDTALRHTRQEFGEVYQLPYGDGWALYFRNADLDAEKWSERHGEGR